MPDNYPVVSSPVASSLEKLPFAQWLTCLALLCLFLGGGAPLWAAVVDDFLPVDEAFRLAARPLSPDTVELSWEIAEHCYLYRHRFKVDSLTPGIKVTDVGLPEGQFKQDPLFGEVKIFKQTVNAAIRLNRPNPAPAEVELGIVYQGCDESGMCYMPERKTVKVSLPARSADYPQKPVSTSAPSEYRSEQDEILATLSHRSAGFVILSFYGFGLLLAFTPCVFPMLPIISGIVAGHGKRITGKRAFWLSFCYVLASALTYTLFGVIAGMFGNNVQAFMQMPWVIALFSAVFAVLAFAMFDWYQFQIPVFIQSRLTGFSAKRKSGGFWGAGLMGVFSALIIGPCVTAPLAGALLYISRTGDAVLGGFALFALGMGMGTPLLALGTYAGKLLPKAGKWMNAVKSLFGIGLLAVAISLLTRIVQEQIVLYLWLALSTVPIFLLMKQRWWRLAGTLIAAYGIMLWLGFSGRLTSRIPDAVCSAVAACEAGLQSSVAFTKIADLEDLNRRLAEARSQNKPAVLDFYADWCSSCVEMKHTTFAEPAVHRTLSGALLLQADVTQNSDADKALMRHFNLIGPPAILFFHPKHHELTRYRIIGYMEGKSFLNVLQNAFGRGES